MIATPTLALVFSAAMMAQSTPLADARTLINNDQPAAAIEKLRALETDGRPEVALLRGVAYYHLNDHARAIELLVPLAKTFSEGSVEQREVSQVLGLSYFLAGRYADAVPRLEATRKWAPANTELGYVLGQAYLRVSEPDKARAEFARLFGLDVKSAGAHVLTAQMMIRLELETLAEAELKRAIDRDPKIPQAHLLIGQIALFRGRLDEAIAATARELAINPSNAMALHQLGDAQIRQGQFDEGVASLQKSIWINPYYSAPYIVLGRAYLQKGQLATAEGMLKRAIEYDPNNRTAHYTLGQLYQRSGRLEEAKRELAIAEKLQSQTR
jgi:tetratricopeptide (TPR) repeat protein